MLSRYAQAHNAEIICVDGGSADGTLELIKSFNVKLVSKDIKTRAGRLNEGIQCAQGDVIILHHPRSILSFDALSYIQRHHKQLTWGAFTHQFDISHPLLAFTSWYSNKVRGDLRHIYYLDHCLFAKKSLLEQIGMVPERAIFEDTDLCLRLRRVTKPRRLPFLSVTSAIRFTQNSIYKQAFINQKLKWQYYFSQSDHKMNKAYEKGLNLNTEYEHSRSYNNKSQEEKQ